MANEIVPPGQRFLTFPSDENMYFGGAGGETPRAAPGTGYYQETVPPGYTEELWRFENARREAEREREMIAQFTQQGQDTDDAQKAIMAATQFQGIRGYQRDLAEGKSAQEAATKWAPLMFAGTAGGPPAFAAMQPRPAAQVQDITIGGMPGRRITQPSGTISERILPKVVDPVE